RQLADHGRPVQYEMRIPPATSASTASRRRLFVLQPSTSAARANRVITADAEAGDPRPGLSQDG
ncbi:MAG TPA: hypothetical protein VF516_16430, partial [Kofleriaceae bacterium]